MSVRRDGDRALVPSEWEYRCPVCGRTLPATDADMLRDVRDGFPACCGEVMVLQHRDDWPGPLQDGPARTREEP
jgi:hypothetical protein